MLLAVFALLVGVVAITPLAHADLTNFNFGECVEGCVMKSETVLLGCQWDEYICLERQARSTDSSPVSCAWWSYYACSDKAAAAYQACFIDCEIDASIKDRIQSGPIYAPSFPQGNW